MLDVDTALIEPKIWCVSPSATRGSLEFVVWFIFIGDAIQVQPVSDLQLLEALNELPLKCAQVLGFNVQVVLVQSFEVLHALVDL
jgi:hypothetical protein